MVFVESLWANGMGHSPKGGVGIYPIHNLFYLCPAMHDPLECKRDLSHGMMLWLKPVSLSIVGAEQFYPTAVKEPCLHRWLHRVVMD
jgi:hypothetical protein